MPAKWGSPPCKDSINGGSRPLPAKRHGDTLPAPMRLSLAVLSLALTLAHAPVALALPPARTASVDLLPRSGTALRTVETAPFSLVGVRWQGRGEITFRTRSLDGRWSAWRPAAPEPEDGPDPRARERGPAGWRLGNPWWTGPSDALQVRAHGRVGRVRAQLVWSPEVRIPLRRLTEVGAPPIVSRLAWGANESIRRAPPVYAPAVRFAIVHHTAGRNEYTRAEAPAIVRAIQLFHVQGNGWNDIGYNFLVDRFGTIYEGRFGGIDRNVVGAHAMGFNTGSVGIALIGSYGDTAPSAAAREAIARLLAWRLDLAHVDPTGLLTLLSSGSERYPRGVPVTLRAVSGHRDTGLTECPGDELYARLDELARSARRAGGDKLFDPSVETSGQIHRFRARLSSRLRWSVVVQAPNGAEVARESGTGSSVDWTWDASGVPEATYGWTIAAGSARPARGTLRTGGLATLGLEEVALEPAAISPNGDGQADVATLTLRLPVAANISVEVVDVTGAVVLVPIDRVWTRAGTHTVEIVGDTLLDGRYEVVVRARSPSGQEVRRSLPITVSRVLGLVSVSPQAFSPNGDGRQDAVTLRFSVTASAVVRVRVLREGRGVVALLPETVVPAGAQRLVWTGLRAHGPVRDGEYAIAVEARDEVAGIAVAAPVVVDTRAPWIRVREERPRPVLEVSERARVRLRVNGGPTQVVEVDGAGTVDLPAFPPARRIRAVALDLAGNRSPVLVWTTRIPARRAQ